MINEIKNPAQLIRELEKVGKLDIYEPKEKFDKKLQNHQESMFCIFLSNNDGACVADGFGETLLDALCNCIKDHNSRIANTMIDISLDGISKNNQLSVQVKQAIKKYHLNKMSKG